MQATALRFLTSFLRFLLWLVFYLVASAVVFGLVYGAVYFVQGSSDSFQPVPSFDLGLAASVGAYGVFHWFLLGAVTLPITAAPVLLWAFLERNRYVRQAGRLRVLGLSAAIGTAAYLLRLVALEYPALISSPSAFFSLLRTESWIAVVLGLFISRTLLGAIPFSLGGSCTAANNPIQVTDKGGA